MNANCKVHFIQVTSCVFDVNFLIISLRLRESVTRASRASFHYRIENDGLNRRDACRFLVLISFHQQLRIK